MNRWQRKYRPRSAEGLGAELTHKCLKLRLQRPAAGGQEPGPAPSGAASRPGDSAQQRCVFLSGCADRDFARALEAQAHADELLRSVHAIAVMLGRLGPAERLTEG